MHAHCAVKLQARLANTPLHPLPLGPQLPAASAHSLSGSVPAATAAQVPLVLGLPVLAVEQASHWKLQAELQQKPSTQKPFLQSAPLRQGKLPGSWSPSHTPGELLVLQCEVATHWALFVQLARHEVKPHV